MKSSKNSKNESENGSETSEIKRISDLIPDSRNANKGTERGGAMIEESLRRFGAGRSILIDKYGNVIAGNKTLEHAGSIGMEDVIVIQTDGSKIVAVQRTDLDLKTDARAKELAVADNRAGEVSLEWDPGILAALSQQVDLSGFFTVEELAALVLDGAEGAEEDVPEARIDEADELQKKWGTARDQVWSIPSQLLHGRPHRLMCGDSTTKADVAALMGTVRARMAFTDPPWNVAIGQDSNPRHRQRPGLKNDSLPASEFTQFLRGFVGYMVGLTDGDIYVVMSSGEWPTIDGLLRSSGLHWSGTIIWAKDSFVLGRSNYHRRFEPIWYGWNRKAKSSYCAGRDQDDVWEIARPKVSEEHPTMKPVALPVRAISNSSVIGDVIYEPFAGGGSTMIAAEHTGRLCYAMEVAPKYVAVTLQRMQDMEMKPELVQESCATAVPA